MAREERGGLSGYCTLSKVSGLKAPAPANREDPKKSGSQKQEAGRLWDRGAVPVEELSRVLTPPLVIDSHAWPALGMDPNTDLTGLKGGSEFREFSLKVEFEGVGPSWAKSTLDTLRRLGAKVKYKASRWSDIERSHPTSGELLSGDGREGIRRSFWIPEETNSGEERLTVRALSQSQVVNSHLHVARARVESH